MNKNKHILKLLLPIFFMFSGNEVFGQGIEKFTKDSVEFLEEIRDMMMDVRRKEGKEFIDDQFTPVWYSGKITSGQREKVYEVANLMLEERMRPYPQFQSFFSSVKSFFAAGRSNTTFNSWTEGLKKMLEGRNTREFDEYLKMSAHLFSENILYKSRSTVWQASTPDYELKFDKEPYIEFPQMDLKCYAKRDSSTIYNTQGVYYPLDDEWIGQGGKVTWSRAGFDTSQTYATLRDYNIKVHSSSFDADSVKFYNEYFDKPLLGKLTEKVLASRTGKKALYPKFDSYDKRLFIKDLVENVDYNGGLSMSGANLLGSGTDEEPAILRFYRNNELKFKASGLNFTISPTRIGSQKVRSVFYIDEDSITHPQLVFKFIKENRELSLIRKDEGLYKTPYSNSYHELDMYFEALYWKIDDPLIEMGTLKGSSEHNAAFESSDYFRKNRYTALKGMANIHPFIRIKRFTQKTESRRFHLETLAGHMKLPVRQVSHMLLTLSTKGFVDYNTETKMVEIKQKLFDYIAANSEKKDYDVILFNSIANDYVNATLSLLDYKLDVKGVSRVDLSDVQNASVFPSNGEVSISKNRNFTFSGAFRAGKLNFYGSKYSFEYDEFEMNLLEVDSCTMYARQLDDGDGDTSMLLVRSAIEDLKGKVRIDNPYNKSGTKSEHFPQFPVLKCTQKSYVYYDEESIHGGAYEKERFYFQLEPFEMDSLSNFDNKGLAFDGTFSSGGILPDFKETLTLMHDHSLGFERDAPEEGFPLYGGQAQFDNKVKLSNNGLQGDGTLNFMTSTTNSELFTFFPDSTTGIAETFVNEPSSADPNVPSVKGEKADIKFIPGENILTVNKRKKPLKFYDEDVDLHGGLELQKSGMTGHGNMKFETADLSSKEFSFKRHVTDADTADFNLASLDQDAMAFKTNNVNAHVDFKNRKAEFKSNGENSYVEFPANQYICYMDKFNWFMDANDVELEASKDVQDININTDLDLSGSNFYSTHPDQDSLNFMAPKARYSIDDKEITCREIPYIPVADARVKPDSNKIKIYKDAEIETMQHAKILANSITKYHTIHDATVDIFSKNDYSGSGDYYYEDENKMKQTIHYGNISVDTTTQTYATGKILEKDGFTLSPNFKYHGKVRMEASEKFLEFTGKVKILHECSGLDRNWMHFSIQIDPNEIMIPVDSSNMGGETQIANGIVLSPEPVNLYSTFLSKKKSEDDIHVLSAQGFLTFAKGDQEYRISNEEKLKNKSLPGNYVSIDKKTCQVEGDGNIDFGCDLGQIKTNPFGNIKHNVVKDSFSLSTALPLDFFMNEKALEEMAEKVKEHPNVESYGFQKKTYENALREIVGMEKTDEIISDLTLKGKVRRFPDELEKSLFLANINFTWDEASASYRSNGPIGIASVLDEQVFKYVDGHVEINKKRSGDRIRIYLELDKENWYYFEYRKNILQTISSNDEYNKIIKETKNSNRKYDNPKGTPPFSYMLSSERKKIRFLSEIE